MAGPLPEAFGASGPATVGHALQLEFDIGEHPWVEQLTQFLGAEQITQQVTIERQSGGACATANGPGGSG